VNTTDTATLFPGSALRAELTGAIDDRALSILERRRRAVSPRRGWLVRRMLLVADALGLAAAFLAVQLFVGSEGGPVDRVSPSGEFLIFLITLPVWVLAAKLYGLYDRDEERTDHSTVDELVGVFHVVSAGVWLVFAGSWLVGLAEPNAPRMFIFWALAVGLVTAGRAGARSFCRHSVSYLQNTVIVGAGNIGQLVARKFLQHPEYGINLVGFVDANPRERRADIGHLAVLGPPEQLAEIVGIFDIERIVIAFSGDSHEETLELVRSLKNLGVQVDIVPRLFELLGPNVEIHTVEGLPLVGLPPASISRSSRLLKRTIDVTGALVCLAVTAPLFLLAALLIKRDSPGPVFFRQARLGLQMREFTVLKFRTMACDVDDAAHREFIKSTMSASAIPETNGLYKLERPDAITRVGRWLRRTSLDELPQLLNVLRGDMSLVGPRPCLSYETDHFAPHHFERFRVPAGITGLWQVTARARSTFGEALDMDVAYARGWSLGLDLWLLCKTPVNMLRRGGTA
jgi:exopolysaccharide biosynthesis polyprenyl glycosylphosphotransferase